ncbi:hypothetical protein [uncultured Bradyrhizobium sp.]|jgi:hypothetical protein|uniref:hypothetical protein n=1 Tax=uncultured Bradyrhizobium sp. TaxID=199684 RepID=UPI002619BD0C|nr:hypothetical protein [uncultured Bradyrhizobium sp.]
MNEHFDAAPGARQFRHAAIPLEAQALAPTPLLLPGEHLQDYQDLQRTILSDLTPSSPIGWLLALDVAELSWEIQRYRLLRHKTLDLFRQQAIESALHTIDVACLASEAQEKATAYTRRNAQRWRVDPVAAHEIETRLAAYGFDQHSISAAMYAQARELFTMFEGLISSAQQRRTLILKALDFHGTRALPDTRPLRKRVSRECRRCNEDLGEHHGDHEESIELTNGSAQERPHD